MPMCTMRVVQEIEQQKHRYGPSNGSAINDAVIGQQLRMEFALNPPSGMLVVLGWDGMRRTDMALSFQLLLDS